MNREETLQLFQDGAEAWKVWADDMLSNKHELMDSGKWTEKPETDGYDDTKLWYECATANFYGHVFTELADFTRYSFPGDANFSNVTFNESAYFSGTLFHGVANFDHVTFENYAKFDETMFKQSTSFLQAKFSAIAIFNRATFAGEAQFMTTHFTHFAAIQQSEFFEDVWFNQSVFETPFHVIDSTFKKNVNFATVSGKGLLLRKVNFARLPNFESAHFAEAPQFDHVDLDPNRLNKVAQEIPRSNYPAGWRALRRLAAQAHDHERELQFFKGETIARRGILDKTVNLRFWVGWCYEIFSDFGRSIARPLGWLLLSIWLFAGIYASFSPELSEIPSRQPVSCVFGIGNAQIAAWALSLHNAFPFTGIGTSGKLEQLYACLYGIRTGSPSEQVPLQTGESTNIPDPVVFLGVLQFFLSAVLLFLLILAIRNLFRIR